MKFQATTPVKLTLSLVLIFVFAATELACSPRSSNKSEMPVPIPETPPKEEARQTLGGQGTSSNGGGGNTIEGKTAESYVKSITGLPEFKTYILPILRRLSSEPRDVMLVYLQWSIHSKPWYFVPVKLDKVAENQTGLPFHSDQTARNTKDSVYIYHPGYLELSPHDRARLLLHEMVMSARFLMKQTVQNQCLALARASDIGNCKDPAVLKLGVDTVATESERETLNSSEHERVRLMTNFLMDPKQELVSDDVIAMRMRLGFHYPFDSIISSLKPKDLGLVLTRSEAALDHFLAADLNFVHEILDEKAKSLKKAKGGKGKIAASNAAQSTKQATECFLSYGYIGQSLELKGGAARDLRPDTESVIGVHSHSLEEELNEAYDTFDPELWQTSVSVNQTRPIPNLLQPKIRGVVVKSISDDLIDQVTIFPPPDSFPRKDAYQIDFFVSRGKTPRLLQYTVTPVNLIRKSERIGVINDPNSFEFVPVTESKPLKCRLYDPP